MLMKNFNRTYRGEEDELGNFMEGNKVVFCLSKSLATFFSNFLVLRLLGAFMCMQLGSLAEIGIGTVTRCLLRLVFDLRLTSRVCKKGSGSNMV